MGMRRVPGHIRRRYRGVVSTDPGPPPMPPDEAVSAVAALADDTRRRTFDAVRAARGPVTRQQAAAAVGISRKLAAFHLDKLVGAGLLRCDTAPRDGARTVGRTPKAYAPASTHILISLPERQH